MSESALPLKKAGKTIAVTWILSTITTLTRVHFAPIPRTWHEVPTFSGIGTKPDNAFYISNDHWRICWFAGPAPLTEDTSFRFWMWKSDDPFPPQFDSNTMTASDFDKQYLNHLAGVEYITGKGRFIIDVMANSTEWEIFVEAYY